MKRRRVYEPSKNERLKAIDIVEVFNDRPWEYQQDLDHPWPDELQNVGHSLAIAYASDKWRPGGRGEREMELYKHISESRNMAFVKPGMLVDERSDRWPVIGPMVNLRNCPFPDSFAILGLFEEIDLQLYTKGTNRSPSLSDDLDEGVVKVTVRHGMLGASMLQWSEVDGSEDEPFLFVYTAGEGPLIVILGDELGIERDGIVG